MRNINCQSVRKWGIGLGAAALLIGGLALKFCPSKDTINIQEPSLTETFSPRKDAGLRQPHWIAKLRSDTLKRLDSGLPPSESRAKTQNSMDLKQVFEQLRDYPVPLIDVEDSRGFKKFSIQTEGLCSEEEFQGRAALQIDGEHVGFLSIGGSGSSFDYEKVALLSGIKDDQGNLLGFRKRIAFVSSEIPFISLSGRESKVEQVGYPPANGETYIYHPEENYSLGSINSKGQFINSDGVTVGWLDKNEVYLPIYSTPSCEDEGGNSSGITSFLRFSSLEEFELFQDMIKDEEPWLSMED